jgi:hypothetical protein
MAVAMIVLSLGYVSITTAQRAMYSTDQRNQKDRETKRDRYNDKFMAMRVFHLRIGFRFVQSLGLFYRRRFFRLLCGFCWFCRLCRAC